MRLFTDVQRDARVALAAVPVTPVALDVAQPDGELVHGGLDFLQAEHVRLFALDEGLQLRLARADAVDVPGRDLHQRAIIRA